MKANTNINIRTNGTLKAEATDVLRRMGLDMSTAVNLFLTQVVLRGAMPFDIIAAPRPAHKIEDWESKVFVSEESNAPLERPVPEAATGRAVEVE